MREIIDAGEVLKIKVGVDLGGRDVCMTQQFLDAAQILARLEQMRCKGVAKEVRVDVHRQALFAGATRHGFIRQEQHAQFIVVNSVNELFERFAHFHPVRTEKWLTRQRI